MKALVEFNKKPSIYISFNIIILWYTGTITKKNHCQLNGSSVWDGMERLGVA